MNPAIGSNATGGEKKVIRINPEMFKLANNNTRKKGTEKKEPKPIKMKAVNHDKTLKRDMLRRIRANQAEQYDKIFGGSANQNSATSVNSTVGAKNLNGATSVNSTLGAKNLIRISAEEKFDDGFKDTLDFMNKLVDKHKREPVKLHNQTIRAPDPRAFIQPQQSAYPQPIVPQQQSAYPQPIVPQQQSAYPQPSVPQQQQSVYPQPSVPQQQQPAYPQPFVPMPLVQTPIPGGEPPKYGCLKNGSLPTYRTSMNKTVKATDIQETPKTDNAIERIRARLNERANRQHAIKVPKTKPNKIIRRTYHVGKDKYRPSVGVLLPNRTIRNNVTNKSFMLKNTSIDEIRRFLLKQGFIKVGSTSPNDVLRKMYESIMMIDGEIKNYNPDSLLYNFFNDKAK